jgi:gamma-glutamyltranspeptidase/glutathione hydrolase
MRRRLRFPRAAVATPHYLASAAGLSTLARGGNAVDAVIAANLALGVVSPYFCGYGGDIFAIVCDGQLSGYLGSGRSPADDDVDRLRARTQGDHMPVFGASSVTVPGGVAGWFDLLERFGTRSFGELATDAVQLARDGFEVTTVGAVPFAEATRMYRGPQFAAWEAMYGDVTAGSVLRQPALATLIERLANDGPDGYYRGPVAEAITRAISEGGGAMGVGDLEAHAGEWAEPMRVAYRDVEVAELPPPTQGVTVLETLRILDGLELPASGAAREHLLVEALKQAIADRDRWVTDPAAMPRPAAELLTDSWVDARRGAIDPERAVHPDPGVPQPGGTAYLCAADADGLLVSLIQSNFIHFGSGVHVPEWGINLNNRGFSFSLDPARPNVYAGGKRPMHTLIPAMALRGGEPVLVFGSMGGDAQAGVHTQLLASIVDRSDDPADAIGAPRWRVDPMTWHLRAETRMSDDVLDGLRARGHEIEATSSYDWGMGHAHAIWPTSGGYGATFDPRSEGAALGR